MKYFLLLLSVFVVLAQGTALAAGDAEHPPKMHWRFEGPFGTFDRAALQRGFQVYKQVCSACHSMHLKSYRNLKDLGYTDDEVKAIAAEYTVEDGPNDEGEMFERAAQPSDHFKSPFPNDAAAKYANNGALPPDLSLIVKARHDGPNYVYGILTGFEEAPADVTLLTGQYYNKYMAGHVIAMAPPLSDGIVSYEDGSDGTIEQYAKDVVQFLTWAASPEMEARKRMGIKVLLFLFAFAGIMYAVKRKIWSDVSH